MLRVPRRTAPTHLPASTRQEIIMNPIHRIRRLIGILAVGALLAFAAASPAMAATARLPHYGSSDTATASPCSEVCSGGGYASGTSNTTSSPTYSIPMILNDVGNPGPCSEVCSGGGYGSVSQPSPAPGHSTARNTATIPPAAARVVTQSAAFHWGDAGIGADGMLALTVIALGGALTLTHRRSHRIHD
jgi:hypothetical protein